jgi:hypothetical protein
MGGGDIEEWWCHCKPRRGCPSYGALCVGNAPEQTARVTKAAFPKEEPLYQDAR